MIISRTIKRDEKSYQKIEYETFSNKDLSSNIDNTVKNNVIDNPFEILLKELAVFGKDELNIKKEAYEI